MRSNINTPIDKTAVLALADAPSGTGRLISDALNWAGKSWEWFLEWIAQPGNLKRLVAVAKDMVNKDWAAAVKDAVDLFQE